MTQNPLYTDDQRDAETLSLRLIERADVRAAREATRAGMLADPAAATLDGSLGLDRALDQWLLALAMREANGDTANPGAVWAISNPPRSWFGHYYHGGAVAIDNPDNFNREIPIDGNGSYAIDIVFSADPPQFSVLMEIEPAHRAGIDRNLGAFTLQQLLPACGPDRRVTVTVGPEPRPDSRFHLLSERRLCQIYTRDSQADWNQEPARVSVRRIDPPAGWRPPTEDEVAAALIANLPHWVRFWRGFKDGFLGFPEPNRLIGPNSRDGGWGYLAGGRYRLADDEALVVRLDPAGSYYTGFQITDPWTIAPDPMYRTVSINKSQCVPGPDGTVTYVLGLIDPGVANWVDTGGLHEGWMLARWQGVPAGAAPERFIRAVTLVKHDELDRALGPDVPRIDAGGRREQLFARAAGFAKRTSAAGWAA